MSQPIPKPAFSYAPKLDIQAATRKSMGEEINGIHDSLTNLETLGVTKLPESVFVNNFLPLFTGEKVPNQVNLGVWSGIAGNPYAVVDVVDDKGEVLYTVPALFDREAMTPGKASPQAQPMAHVMTTTSQLRNVHPAQATRYLEKQLNLRNIHGGMQARMVKNIDAWNIIFARYNKPLITTDTVGLPTIAAGETPATAVQKVQESRSEGLNYDDDIL